MKRRLLWGLGFAIGQALAALWLLSLVSGCTPDAPRIVHVPERIGGPVASVLSEAAGAPVQSTTLPGGWVLVWAPTTPCVLEHEAAHVAQQRENPLGSIGWGAAYLVELHACLKRTGDAGECYRGHSLEVGPMAVMRACEEAR